jgi:hypothetical protein
LRAKLYVNVGKLFVPQYPKPPKLLEEICHAYASKSRKEDL